MLLLEENEKNEVNYLKKYNVGRELKTWRCKTWKIENMEKEPQIECHRSNLEHIEWKFNVEQFKGTLDAVEQIKGTMNIVEQIKNTLDAAE